MLLKPQSLNIFADCCHSGTFIDVCQVFHYFQDFVHKTKFSEDFYISALYKLSFLSLEFSQTKLGGDVKSTFEHLFAFFASNRNLSEDEQRALNNTIFKLCCSLFQSFPKVTQFDSIRTMLPSRITTLDLSELSESHRNIIQNHFPTIGDLFDIGYFLYAFQEHIGHVSIPYEDLLGMLNQSFPIFVDFEKKHST